MYTAVLDIRPDCVVLPRLKPIMPVFLNCALH